MSKKVKRHIEKWNRWGLFQWCPKIALKRNQPGKTFHFEHLIFDYGKVATFKTRQEARQFAEATIGYMKKRPDLRGYPHYWRMPIPIKIDGIIWRKP